MNFKKWFYEGLWMNDNLAPKQQQLQQPMQSMPPQKMKKKMRKDAKNAARKRNL